MQIQILKMGIFTAMPILGLILNSCIHLKLASFLMGIYTAPSSLFKSCCFWNLPSSTSHFCYRFSLFSAVIRRTKSSAYREREKATTTCLWLCIIFSASKPAFAILSRCCLTLGTKTNFYFTKKNCTNLNLMYI